MLEGLRKNLFIAPPRASSKLKPSDLPNNQTAIDAAVQYLLTLMENPGLGDSLPVGDNSVTEAPSSNLGSGLLDQILPAHVAQLQHSHVQSEHGLD